MSKSLKETIEGFIFSEKDPFDVAEDIVKFIEQNYTLRKNNAKERWILDTSKWIDVWIELFPEGVKGGSKLLRSDKKICLTKMAQFRVDYPEFNMDDICQATVNYVEEQSEKDFAYTMPAVNFISHREKGSELAARCKDLELNKHRVKKEYAEDFFL